MVRAILDGRKSQTRRVVKSLDLAKPPWARCPYGAPGDELWVRETFGVLQTLGADRDHDGERYVYRADPASDYQWSGAAAQGFRWLPSIFMPRSVSRLTLVVKSVRVERLSAITDEDAKAEGFEPHTFEFETQEFNGSFRPVPLVYSASDQYLRAFRTLNKLAADADPLVWVIEFERKQGGAA